LQTPALHARRAASSAPRALPLSSPQRDCPGAGTYDKVVSCEMIEAVGHEHLVSYFSQIGRMLKPGGKAVIQVAPARPAARPPCRPQGAPRANKEPRALSAGGLPACTLPTPQQSPTPR
jgi:cyclopropane fatty-acyl-phospholipid synthase-like methyltransferase